MIDAKVLTHLRHGCSFHLHGVCLQGCMEPPPLGIGLEELIPRHHGPEHDVWLSLENRREFEVSESLLYAPEQFVGGPVAELLGGVEERNVTRLVEVESVGFEDAGVVMQDVFGHDDVADAERVIDSACNARDRALGLKWSIASVATIAAFTFPIPAATTTTSRESIMPVRKS